METTEVFFEQAFPVWPEGREREMNVRVGFRTLLKYEQVGKQVLLRLAASCVYRCYVNGQFVGHGPAVAPHGYYRIDEWELLPYLQPGDNVVAIEVAGYNVNSFYTLDQPSFLQAEIVGEQGRILAATGDRHPGFAAQILDESVQRVERYSFQRAFSESYRLRANSVDWLQDVEGTFPEVGLAHVGGQQWLARQVPYPLFTIKKALPQATRGTVQRSEPESFNTTRFIHNIGPDFKGYPVADLELAHWQEMQCWRNDSDAGTQHAESNELVLSEYDYALYKFEINLSGFIGLHVQCDSKVRMYLTFDEIESNGDVQYDRMDCLNMIYLELEAGTYDFETFEPYTLQYLKAFVVEGECRVSEPYIREYAGVVSPHAQFTSSDEALNRIFVAGVDTFRQNALDNFVDCPSRERAGWLCDSFFTSRVAVSLTGNTLIEQNFMENFLLPETFTDLPAGMLPMCYPADTLQGMFIPNWSLWFVLQMEEFAERVGPQGAAQVAAAGTKIERLLQYFEQFENTDGLLEKLESWIFVEWSKANELVRDVNYPTNMLYAAALRAAGRLYDRKDWLAKSEHVRKQVCQQSYDGVFFHDCAQRVDGELHLRDERTEVCQYYAFYFGAATPASHPELWERLIGAFGPQRRTSGAYPEIYPANAFMGHYLRLELLSEVGMVERVITEMRDFFTGMADRTGTLWENDDVRASCNHGFASHVIHLIYRDVLGIRRIDRQQRIVYVQRPNVKLAHATGRMPLGEGVLDISLSTGTGGTYRVQAPEGYQIVEG